MQMGILRLGIEGQGLRKQDKSFSVPPLLMASHAQKMHGGEMLRIRLQNRDVKSRGLVEVARVMKSEGPIVHPYQVDLLHPLSSQ